MPSRGKTASRRTLQTSDKRTWRRPSDSRGTERSGRPSGRSSRATERITARKQSYDDRRRSDESDATQRSGQTTASRFSRSSWRAGTRRRGPIIITGQVPQDEEEKSYKVPVIICLVCLAILVIVAAIAVGLGVHYSGVTVEVKSNEKDEQGGNGNGNNGNGRPGPLTKPPGPLTRPFTRPGGGGGGSGGPLTWPSLKHRSVTLPHITLNVSPITAPPWPPFAVRKQTKAETCLRHANCPSCKGQYRRVDKAMMRYYGKFEEATKESGASSYYDSAADFCGFNFRGGKLPENICKDALESMVANIEHTTTSSFFLGYDRRRRGSNRFLGRYRGQPLRCAAGKWVFRQSKRRSPRSSCLMVGAHSDSSTAKLGLLTADCSAKPSAIVCEFPCPRIDH